jgi:hypothetical protein
VHDPSPQSPLRNSRMTFAQLLFIPRTLAFSVEVFLHTGIGERYADVQAAAALLLIPMYTIFWPGHDPRPMLLFLMLYVAMCFRNRVAGLLRRGAPPEGHSRYTGEPRLLRHFPKHTEASFKLRVEPALVFMIGAAIAVYSEPLGVYLMLAAGGLFVSVLSTAAVDRQLILDLNDLLLEQKERAERFRAMHDDQT